MKLQLLLVSNSTPISTSNNSCLVKIDFGFVINCPDICTH